MLRITNRKVQGFKPVWAPFNGFSLLFDNPGNSYAPLSDAPGLEKINCRYEETETSFYRTLWDVVNGEEHLAQECLLCPLPLHSYHVTVWDGINVFNMHKLPDQEREDAEALLKALPYSRLKENSLLLASDDNSGLFKSERIVFEFDKLENWNNNGVVLRIKPADSESAAIYNNIEKERARLNQHAQERFGIATATAVCKPHVSVGYFANKEQGAQSLEAVEQLNSVLENELKNQTIIFSSISLYGMTDMETFFRKQLK